MRVTGRAVLAGVGMAAMLGWAAPGADAQGILGTKHNLSTSGTQAIKTTDGTAEVCVFCHTPHGADTTVNAPLWNRAINTSGYTMYTSPTYDATTDGQPTGVSLACLSCHDGTIAFDALRNLPGSGGYTDTPSPGGVTGWTFTGTPNKKMPVGGITNLTQDLSNDHPISMQYDTAKSPSSTSAVNDHATGFKPATEVTGAIGTRSGGLVLYSGKVQCGSCHDPHRSNTTTFLRKSNDGSDLCLTCHKKDG